jgi:hypothetical protein
VQLLGLHEPPPVPPVPLLPPVVDSQPMPSDRFRYPELQVKSQRLLVHVPFEFTGGLPQESHWLSVVEQPLLKVIGTQMPPHRF